MRAPLNRILLAGINPRKGDYEVKPDINEEFAETTYNGIVAVIEHIKTFPILHPEEVNDST